MTFQSRAIQQPLASKSFLLPLRPVTSLQFFGRLKKAVSDVLAIFSYSRIESTLLAKKTVTALLDKLF